MRIRPKKDRSPLTRIQRFEHRQDLLRQRLANDNKRYKFRNNTKADLGLPKPSEDGRNAIAPDGEFIGDSYFLCMVPQCLVIVEDLSMKNNENKLITEQPPVVTNEGKVEYVQEKTGKIKLNENKPNTKQPEILLNEDPAGGVVVLE